MRIKKIIRQDRRDFDAMYECEHCGNGRVMNGYDDANFHNNVIPDMVCPDCNKKAGPDYVPRTPKYPEGYQI